MARAYMGIPYAAAPRFAPPVGAGTWDGSQGSAPAPAAPQPVRPIGVFTHGERPRTAEECLTLNVWTPVADDARRPVLVWLHGGGFAVGWASSPLYAAHRLADGQDLVVVTLNYRLGSLGWLAHPELAAGEGAPAGNWGLLDQAAALAWVRDNIAALGGDPGNVTLAGQSAGALCAMDHLVAPGSAGLFRRAILQSPPLGDVGQPLPRAVRWAQDLSRRVGGAEGPLDAAALRSAPAEAIVAAHEELLGEEAWAGTRGGAMPTVEPGSLPRSPAEDPGASPDVDVLVGTTRDEATFFTRVLRGLEPTNEELAALTAQIITGPLDRWAAARAAAGARVHRFRVDHPGAGPDLGATHTSEVPLVFGTWDVTGPGERLAGQAGGAAEVSDAVRRAWAAFARGSGPGWAPQTGAEAWEVGVFGGASGALSVRTASPRE
jgi:para-nitrobenzyl esterase